MWWPWLDPVETNGDEDTHVPGLTGTLLITLHLIWFRGEWASGQSILLCYGHFPCPSQFHPHQPFKPHSKLGPKSEVTIVTLQSIFYSKLPNRWLTLWKTSASASLLFFSEPLQRLPESGSWRRPMRAHSLEGATRMRALKTKQHCLVGRYQQPNR